MLPGQQGIKLLNTVPGHDITFLYLDDEPRADRMTVRSFQFGDTFAVARESNLNKFPEFEFRQFMGYVPDEV